MADEQSRVQKAASARNIEFEFPVLKVKNISKTFHGVTVLKKASFDLFEGEVLALCGENGAGKSTLMKCITGLYKPDKNGGSIMYQGEAVEFKNSLAAKKKGVVMVFQELSLVSELTVAENMYMGMWPKGKYGNVDNKKMISDANEVLKLMDIQIDPKTKVSKLTIAEQQMVEIARALAFNARVLILDEPTSSLTDKEKDSLFDNVRRLKKKGVAVIYISHKMDEVFEISDRILVLRDGEVTGQMVTKESSLDDVILNMVGRTLEQQFYKSSAEKSDEVVLSVKNLMKYGLFEDVSFDVHRGEILGLYGLVGAGRSEIVETIFGIRKKDFGEIYLEGKKIEIRNSKQAVAAGLALVPENRKETGLFLEKNCVENISVTTWKETKKGIFASRKRERAIFDEYKEKMNIAASSPYLPCANLSGGNQQKIVIGKWLAIGPKLLILDEPTKGVDVVAKSEIHKMISDFAGQGMAVLVISSEMPEIMGVSNRILTVKNGRINGEFVGDEITEENLIRAITEVEPCQKTG